MPQVGYLPRQQAFISGLVAPNSVLRFFRTGTSTPQNAYTDSALSNAVTSLTADSAGVFAKWYLNPNASFDYRYTLETSAGAVYYTEDNIPRQPFSQTDVGAVLYPQTAAELAAGVTPTNLFYFPRPQIYLDRYGADPTASSFSDTAMANALLVLAQKGGGTLVLDGSYKFANAYTPAESVVIQGGGMLQTKLTYTGSGDFITFGNSSARNSIRDLWLDGTSKTGVGIRIGGTDFSGMHTISKVRVRNFATGIRMAGALWTTVQDGLIDGNGRGIDFNAGGASLYSTTVELLRNRISANDNEGIACTNVPVRLQTISVRGGSIENNCTTSPGTTSQHVTGGTGGVEQLVIDNVYYEYTGGGTKPNAIDIQNASNFDIVCYVNGSRNGITAEAAAVNDGTIRSSRFVGTVTNDVYINGGSNAQRIDLLRNTYSATNVLNGIDITNYTKALAQQLVSNTSFTPTIRGSGTAGTPTYTVQQGFYSKVGNLVFFTVRVSISAKTGMAGAISIEGLPLSSANNTAGTSIFSAEYSGITVSGGNTYLYAELLANTTSILLMQGGSTSNAQLTDAALAAATTVVVSGCYQT